MSDWKRELKKEEKRDEIKYAKRERKEAIERSLQNEMKRRKKSVKGGSLKAVESGLKHTEEIVREVVLKRKKKSKSK